MMISLNDRQTNYKMKSTLNCCNTLKLVLLYKS